MLRNRWCTVDVLALATLLGFCPGLASGAQLYLDSFDDGTVAVNIRAINGAVLTEANGQLSVDILAAGQGVAIDVPTDQINCFELTISSVSPSFSLEVGDTLSWRWIVTDADTGLEYPLLESDWTKTNSTTFSTRKKDSSGNVKAVRQEVDSADLDFLPPKGKEARVKWDRRTVNGEVQVQLEIVIIDPATGHTCKYVKLFPWQDPPGFTSTRIELTADFPVEVTMEQLAGEDVHVDVEVPDAEPTDIEPTGEKKPRTVKQVH